jgi:hypothetical protein
LREVIYRVQERISKDRKTRGRENRGDIQTVEEREGKREPDQRRRKWEKIDRQMKSE